MSSNVEPVAPGRSRIRAVAAWASVSAVAATFGVLVAGATDVVRTGAGPLTGAVLVGYSGLVAWPALFLASNLVRLLWRGWQPRELAGVLVEEDGSAPRLAGWVAYVGVASLLLSWAVFNSVRWIAFYTAFKPTVVALATPPAAVGAGLVLIAFARPSARALGWAAAKADRVSRRVFRRSVLTPHWILGWSIGVAVAIVVVAWRVSVAPRVGYIDLSVGYLPLSAAATCAAAHPLWRIARRHAPGAALAIAAGSATALSTLIVVALFARANWPVTVLDVWGRPTLASDVIERLYPLEDVRSDVRITVARPVPRPESTGAIAPNRDIVLITIDTVRADRTPLQSGPAQMPNLAALGREGSVFPWAFAPGNVTRRSIPSLATGLHPTRVRGKVAGWALRLDPRHVLLAERFRAAGYDTAGYFCCESFWGPRHRLGINRGIDHLVIEHDGDKLADKARAWLDARAKAPSPRPMFLWVHFLEPHNWMQAGYPSELEERRRRYDNSLAEVDRYLGVVVNGLPTSGDRRPYIVVTADHGESLGDHGAPTHATDLYNAQLRVPLVFTGPYVVAQRIATPVGLVDLVPTLLDLAGFIPPAGADIDGVSLRSSLTTQEPPSPRPVHAAMIMDRSVPYAANAVINGGWKLIETRRGLELYDLGADPNELQNRAKQEPARTEQLRLLLEARRERDRVSPFLPWR